MPREHLDALRRGQEAFNRGEIKTATEVFADDVEWATTGIWPGMEETYHGREGLQEWSAVLRREWDEFEVSVGEVLRDQEDALVVVELLRGRGRESGAQAEMRVYTIYRFNDQGKVAKRRAFTSAEEALAAL
jgi:ketosteroid isomerase-like protein